MSPHRTVALRSTRASGLFEAGDSCLRSRPKCCNKEMCLDEWSGERTQHHTGKPSSSVLYHTFHHGRSHEWWRRNAGNDLSSCTALLTVPAGLRGPNQNSACTVSLKLIFPCRRDGIWINPYVPWGQKYTKKTKSFSNISKKTESRKTTRSSTLISGSGAILEGNYHSSQKHIDHKWKTSYTKSEMIGWQAG